MKRIPLLLMVLSLSPCPVKAQNTEFKFIADTLVVQAEGTYETDPDLATLAFDILSQEKDMKRAYDTATQSMQRIVSLAERTGLKKEDISTGVLTITPQYEGDRRKKPKSFQVRGQIILKIHDFALIGPILDGAVQDEIVDFRSLTYSLQNEEAAKERASAQAMQHAVGRARAVLAEHGQKLGAIRYASLDVMQLVGVAELGPAQVMEPIAIPPGVVADRKPSHAPNLPAISPEKITVSATLHCAFQIQ